MKNLFILISLLFSSLAFAYPQFIGHSYTSCLNCHYNPFGGGQLTDYGRAVSATAISGRALYPESWSEEKLAYMSGFLFSKPKQKWFRPQVNYRGFQLRRNPGSKDNEVKTWIEMQADVRVTLKFGEDDKLIFSADYGKAPTPSQPNIAEEDKYRSRNHYIGYRLNKKVGVYAGLMDKVYGIRIIEHVAYSRTTPQVTQNDQTHGIVGHYLDDKWEGGIHLFMGNLSQEGNLRMKGLSGTVERTIEGGHRVGGSALTSSNEFLKLTSYAAHGRFNFKEGSAILAELGQTHRSTQNGTDDITSRYGLLQTYLRPTRGLYFLANIEYFKKDLSQEGYTTRFGPGIQYFPAQRLELRADLYNTRNINPETSTKDSWILLSQLHIWL